MERWKGGTAIVFFLARVIVFWLQGWTPQNCECSSLDYIDSLGIIEFLFFLVEIL